MINTTASAAYGAARLAAVGARVFASVPAACVQLIQVTARTEPGRDAAVYEQLYPLYQKLYPALQPTFTALAGM